MKRATTILLTLLLTCCILSLAENIQLTEPSGVISDEPLSPNEQVIVTESSGVITDDDAEEVTASSDSPPQSEPSVSASKPLERPQFVPPQQVEDSFFHDMFVQPNHLSKWVVSRDAKYQGEWKVSESPNNDSSIIGDYGLLNQHAARHHAISAKFPRVFDVANRDFVIQYEVRFNKPHECGGAYVKLLSVSNEEWNGEKFTDANPYTIMFGPDKCGTTDKVHFIFRHYNPVSGKTEEKHLKQAPTVRLDRLSHVYTLIVRKDNSFEILIDQVIAKKGSLLEDFEPAVIPSKTIDDPEDKKPIDWVENAKIPDPNVKKPDDWDEDQPEMIVDETAKKPVGWLDDESLTIPDPKAQKPVDWDEQADGDWQAPIIPNPTCEKAVGCGQWKKPMVKNPQYKGKWRAPLIDNPDYKGVWKPRQIANPNYYEDKEPHNMTPMVAVGIEIWSMQDSIQFDNFFIGYNEEAAKKFAQQTFSLKHSFEVAADEKKRADATAAQPVTPGVMSKRALKFAQTHQAALFATFALGIATFLYFAFRKGTPQPQPNPMFAAQLAAMEEEEKKASEGVADANADDVNTASETQKVEQVDRDQPTVVDEKDEVKTQN